MPFYFTVSVMILLFITWSISAVSMLLFYQRVCEVLPSADGPPGTVCQLHYEHQSYHRMPSHVHWRRTCSPLPGTIETFYAILTPNINTLTCLLAYWSGGQHRPVVPCGFGKDFTFVLCFTLCSLTGRSSYHRGLGLRGPIHAEALSVISNFWQPRFKWIDARQINH